MKCKDCGKELKEDEINVTIYDEILCDECFDEWLWDNPDK